MLLGEVVEVDWTTQGVPSKSCMETWPLSLEAEGVEKTSTVTPSLTGDSQYLYTHGSFGLVKLGTGYGNTIKVRPPGGGCFPLDVPPLICRGRSTRELLIFILKLAVGWAILQGSCISSPSVKGKMPSQSSTLILWRLRAAWSLKVETYLEVLYHTINHFRLILQLIPWGLCVSSLMKRAWDRF